jgi:hypothetical protein
MRASVIARRSAHQLPQSLPSGSVKVTGLLFA